MSLTDEQINLLNYDNLRAIDAQQKSLFINNIDSPMGQTLPSSVRTTTQLSPTTHQHSITASVPHQPQLNTTINMSKNLIEKSKSALGIDIQAEYQQKGSVNNLNDDDDFISSEPPSRIDYRKKILVERKILFVYFYI